MKLVFSGTLLACLVLGNALAAEVPLQSQPAVAQKDASLWVARILARYRYKPEGQPDGVGARPFDRFIEALDPEHMLFTQADLSTMEKLRSRLDSLTDEKQMDIPDTIFAACLARATELHSYALEVLRQPLDFTGHQHYQRVRSRAGWEPDGVALRDLWRRHVMDDYLNLRLAGNPEAQIIPVLLQRYDRNLQRVQAMRTDDVANLFLNAYVAYLDPHGAYFGPAKPASDHGPGSMVGIGMVLQKKQDLVTVLEVVPGAPASRSGDIRPGDRIVGVAQGSEQVMTDVTGWRVDDVVEILRGEPGSTVVVDILPQGASRGSALRRISLKRAKIQLDDQRAKGRIELVRQGGGAYRIGVITVPTFYEDFAARKAGAKDYVSVTRDVAAVLEQLKAQKADAILLDMRNNGGGALTEAVNLTGLFLPGVPVVQQVGYERRTTVETASPGAPAWDGPLAVLIGRGSAAATEITAAAIQDHGRGLVIGDVSQGRGTVQTMINLDRFSTDPARHFGELKLTIAALCRANGDPIQGAGVTPDIEVPGRIDVTGHANTDLFAGAACKKLDVTKHGTVDALLPSLAGLHARRMQANPSYQAQLTRRKQDEALLASDDASLNEAERRRTPDARPDGDIAQLQLTEALSVLGDAVDSMRKRPAAPAKEL